MTAKKRTAGKAKAGPRRASSVPVLKNDVEHLTKLVEEHVAESKAFRKETREEIAAINELLARYKGALGLFVLLSSAVMAGIGFAVQYFRP